MAKDNCEIGYKKPPTRSQFKKGSSGNPKGRPKGSLSISSVLMKTGRDWQSIRKRYGSLVLIIGDATGLQK
jgi:hypothetical protein